MCSEIGDIVWKLSKICVMHLIMIMNLTKYIIRGGGRTKPCCKTCVPQVKRQKLVFISNCVAF